jgi:hypothetical protein
MATKKVKLYFVPHHNFTGMSRHLPKFKENRVFIEDDPMWVPQKGDKLVWENSACTILGRYVGQRAGHALTNRLLRALFAQRDAWEVVECGIPAGRKLPGVGVLHSDIPVPC